MSRPGRSAGSAAPEDIDRIRRHITELEQTVVDLTRQLEERCEELDAARAVNCELFAQMNTGPRKNATQGASCDRAAARSSLSASSGGCLDRDLLVSARVAVPLGLAVGGEAAAHDRGLVGHSEPQDVIRWVCGIRRFDGCLGYECCWK